MVVGVQSLGAGACWPHCLQLHHSFGISSQVQPLPGRGGAPKRLVGHHVVQPVSNAMSFLLVLVKVSFGGVCKGWGRQSKVCVVLEVGVEGLFQCSPLPLVVSNAVPVLTGVAFRHSQTVVCSASATNVGKEGKGVLEPRARGGL